MFSKAKNLLANKPGRCVCGTKLAKGQCSHCDFECQKSAVDIKKCKKCFKAVKAMLRKIHLAENHYGVVDPDLMAKMDDIREKTERPWNQFLFPPKDEDDEN